MKRFLKDLDIKTRIDIIMNNDYTKIYNDYTKVYE